MRKFRIIVNGRNFLFSRNPIMDKFQKTGNVCLGFHTTKYVLAEDPDAAQEKAVDAIRQELAGEVINPRENPPRMHIEDVCELQESTDIDEKGRGYVFFPEREQDANIFEVKDD